MSTIVTRAGKGSPLTHVEVDANFNNLNTDKVEKTAADITGGTINGTTIGATSASSVNATTITGQTGVLRGTGQNLLLQSNTFTTSWSISNVTLTSGQSDPFGGSTAYLVNNGTNTGTHPVSQTLTISPNTYTFSVFAKAGTANFLALFSSSSVQGAFFNLTTGAFTGNMINAPVSYASTSVGSGWYRLSITVASTGSSSTLQLLISEDGTNYSYTGTSKTITIYGAQLEIGSVTNTYIPTTTTAVYGTPTLSFSGVSTIGLESNGSLFVQPAGTGALQAQATTSTTAGGNARGANAVDWQTSRNSASEVASGQFSFIGAGTRNTSSGTYAGVVAGFSNVSSGFSSFVGGGNNNTANNTYTSITTGVSNTASGLWSTVVNGSSNTAAGYFNFIGNGFTNSGTSGSAVTTQSGTMNATTAVTLSGSNANIKVGQYITGTSIASDTYVAAISGTSLTLSKVASGSSTSTLSFFTPHGVVVGGGNNQATGSYSFIGGGGDAGTAANRNVASGDWSFVGGGFKNVASGSQSAVVGGRENTASGSTSAIGGGVGNTASGLGALICGGYNNISNTTLSTVVGGRFGTTRSITGNTVFPACNTPLAGVSGVSQAALLILACQTTDATATALLSEGTTAGNTNQVILPNNSAYFFTGEIISGVTGGGNTKGFTIEGVIKRGANAASTALVGTPTVTSTYADAGASAWAIAVPADTTNGGIRVTFTGQAATTIRVVCQIRTTEMTY
jgi:hypothetical protein